MTIYTATNNWIAQGDRLTKIFPSGLVLLQQNYIAPTGTQPSPTLALGQPFPVSTSPCIDGAYIFPAPGFQDNGNGFTTCTVTAYGRNSSTGNKTLTKTISEHTARWVTATDPGENVTNGSQSFPTISDQLLWTFVMPKTAPPNVVASDLLQIYRLSGQPLSPLLLAEFFNSAGHRTEQGVQQISKPVISTISRAECVNFGAFDEWTVVYGASVDFPVFDFGSFFIIAAPQGDNLVFNLTVGGSASISNSDFYKWDSNNSESAQVLKVWNINAPTGSGASSTPRQEMPPGVNSPTYRGGTLRRSGTSLIAYSPPSPAVPGSGHPAPARHITRQQNQSPPPSYTSGAFTWNAVPTGSSSDSEGSYIIYTYQLQTPIKEVFVIELGNELGQTSNYSVVINFSDPE